MISIRCYTEIKFVQKNRKENKTLFFGFVNEFTATDTWVDLTNQATIKIPKNIKAKDQYGNSYNLFGENQNIGGFSNDNPLFLRGDEVSITYGYRYSENGDEKLYRSTVFEGYITEVSSKKPIELKCEDKMYLLKQIPATPQVWKGYVEDLFILLLKDYPEIKVNTLTKTSIGAFTVGNETVAQLLARLRNEAHFEAYFRGNELRIGSQVYLESDNVDANGKEIVKTFVFQQNIISDELMYKRKDDVVLSAVCISRYEDFTGKETKDGQKKTKKERLEILVYWDKKNQRFDYTVKDKGSKLPAAVEGERRTFQYLNVKDAKTLFQMGVNDLKKYYYTGFKGKFTTFAMPYVRQGDNVMIKDPILPERNGKYKVKGVEYSGGVNGHRQTVILDYKI